MKRGIGLPQLNEADKGTLVAGDCCKSVLAHLLSQSMLPQQLSERHGRIEFLLSEISEDAILNVAPQVYYVLLIIFAAYQSTVITCGERFNVKTVLAVTDAFSSTILAS